MEYRRYRALHAWEDDDFMFDMVGGFSDPKDSVCVRITRDTGWDYKLLKAPDWVLASLASLDSDLDPKPVLDWLLETYPEIEWLWEAVSRITQTQHTEGLTSGVNG